MEHIAAILLMVGCSGDLKQCDEIPPPTVYYETSEACGADLSPALSQVRGSHPRIFGTCVYVDPALESEDAELVWDIDRDGKLSASIETSAVVMASEATHPSTDSQQ